MNNGYVAVLDSGIGGFSVLAETARIMPNERFLYFGDSANAPYGNKPLGELYALTKKNLDLILRYNVKAVIFGCNTLSLTVLPVLAPFCSVPIFGVYPPVNCCSERTFLFATPLTCEALTRKNSFSGIKFFPLDGLAFEIEAKKYDLEHVDLAKHLKTTVPFGGNFSEDILPKVIILGCTHYFFVKEQFKDHFCPQKILCGEENTAKRVTGYLAVNRIFAKNQEFSVDFIGEKAEENFNFYYKVVKKIIFPN